MDIRVLGRGLKELAPMISDILMQKYATEVEKELLQKRFEFSESLEKQRLQAEKERETSRSEDELMRSILKDIHPSVALYMRQLYAGDEQEKNEAGRVLNLYNTLKAKLFSDKAISPEEQAGLPSDLRAALSEEYLNYLKEKAQISQIENKGASDLMKQYREDVEADKKLLEKSRERELKSHQNLQERVKDLKTQLQKVSDNMADARLALGSAMAKAKLKIADEENLKKNDPASYQALLRYKELGRLKKSLEDELEIKQKQLNNLMVERPEYEKTLKIVGSTDELFQQLYEEAKRNHPEIPSDQLKDYVVEYLKSQGYFVATPPEIETWVKEPSIWKKIWTNLSKPEEALIKPKRKK